MIGNITANVLMQGSAFRASCSFSIHNGRQGVVLHLDKFCCIFGDIAGVCHDHCHRFTNKAHLVYGHGIILYWLWHSYRKRPHLASHISSGNDSYHPWNLKGGFHFDVAYDGMRVWAANNSGNFAAGERMQVVYVAASPSHEPFIFYPGDWFSNPAKLFCFHRLCSLDLSF